MKWQWTLVGAGNRVLRLLCRRADAQKPDVVSPVLTVKEVCRRLGKSRRQVYRYLRTARLKPCAQILGQWLFAPEAVSRFEHRRLPHLLRPFFWDVQLADLAVDEHRDFILARLLDFGDRAAIQWIFRTYPREVLVAFLKGRGAQLLARRTWGFWALLLGLKAERRVESRWRARARHWGGIA